MTVAALFPSQDAVLDIAVPDKAALFALLSAEASERLNHPASDILEALEEREELGSTALGRGVALPHSRLSWLPAPFALLARLREPIDFDARDGEPVDLVFLVLWPDSNPEGFVPALSEICRALRAERLLRQLRKAGSAAEAFAVLQAADHAAISPE